MGRAVKSDLFTPAATDYDLAQDRLREAMIASHQRDLADLKQRGILPPWVERDIILQEDEFKLLSLIDDVISLPLDEYTTEQGETDAGLFGTLPTYTKRRNVTGAIGMRADNNSAAVINRSLKNGWIVEINYEGKRYLELTDDGQDALWDHQDNLTF